MENLIVFDWPAKQDDPFVMEVERVTGETWKVLGFANNAGKKEVFKSLLKLIHDRKKYDKIIFWQQKHGIFYSYISSLLRLKKYNKTIVLTLIYKSEAGLKGRIKRHIFRKAVKSKYVDLFVCYSKTECSYYSKLFSEPIEKFDSTMFGVADEFHKYENKIADKGYLLAAGNSNRDYQFLVEAITGTPYQVKIVDYTCTIPSNENVEVLKNIKYGADLYELISYSKAMIVPLKDGEISAGQTVIIQALMLGKPVIVTEGNGTLGYVKDGVSGFVIKKTSDELLNAIQKISDDAMYKKMSETARKEYIDMFSYSALGRNVGELAKKHTK